MSRKEWRKRCSGPAFFITGKDKGKLGYYWEHVFLKAKSGPNLGGVVNPDTGLAILDSERQKLTYLDFDDKIKLSEIADSAAGRNDAVFGSVASGSRAHSAHGADRVCGPLYAAVVRFRHCR